MDDVADELYALTPEEFTAARDDAAKRVDGDLRKAVKALRKPTASAYVVNALVRERRVEVEALVALGDEMRDAMTGKGDVRALTEERRHAIGELVAAGADAAGRVLTAAIEQEVAATFEAATADPELGAAVLSGRLVKPLRYAGFGTAPDVGDALATPLPATSKAKPKTKTRTSGTAKTAATSSKRAPANKGRTSAAKKAEPAPPSKELTRMRSRVLELSGIADDAQRRYDVASRAAAEARTLLDQAEKERAEAHKAANDAHREAEMARRELGRLERS